MHLNPVLAQLLGSFNNPLLPSIDLSRDRMTPLLAALGNPQHRLPPVIHVAGTNGKGSTIAFMAAIYAAAGYRVHRYISPHLVRFNERILLAGEEIPDAHLEQLLTQVQAACATHPATFFEATTAAAFLAFAETPADLLLLEVGLGGRLDATNFIPAPLATVITPMGLDHTEFLGDSLAQIAAEKAGIMKQGVPCFAGAQMAEAAQVLMECAARLDAPLCLRGRDWDVMREGERLVLYPPTKPSGEALAPPQGGSCPPASLFAPDCEAKKNSSPPEGEQALGGSAATVPVPWGASITLPTPSLIGVHQHANAGLAAAVALGLQVHLPITTAHLADGIAHAHWPARLQRLTYGPAVAGWGARGAVFLDGGHNAHAAEALAAWIATQSDPIYMICGMMGRKDASAYFAPLAGKLAGLVCMAVPHAPDTQSPEILAEAARAQGISAMVATGFEDALAQLSAASTGTLLIAGSLYLAGEVLKTAG